MNRIDRLFGILMLLQSKKYVAPEKIADKFNISIRTVYRDVKALCEQGVPVSYEQQKGYFIVQGFFLPPVSFTSEEAAALLLMEGLTKGFADQSIQTYYSTALGKIKNVLRSQQKEKMEILSSSTQVQLPSCFSFQFEYLSVIQDAITSKRLLQLHYKNSKEEVSLRDVEPIGLIFYALNWHLIAWCHIRKDYRDFKVARILKLQITDVPFSKTDHILLDDYMKSLPVSF